MDTLNDLIERRDAIKKSARTPGIINDEDMEEWQDIIRAIETMMKY